VSLETDVRAWLDQVFQWVLGQFPWTTKVERFVAQLNRALKVERVIL
jgi:hypothetical protein